MTLNYKSYGTGEPVIILHGLFGMLDNWQSFGKILAEQFEVFLVDQRNHGRSFHSDAMDYPLLAADVAAFIKEHKISSPALIGHSMGGKVSMQVSLDYPKLVRKQVLVDIGPKSYPASHLNIFESILAIDLSTKTTRKEVESELALNIRDQAIRQFLLKNLKREAEGQFVWKTNFLSLHKNYSKLIGNIYLERNNYSTIPSLFVRGENSSYLSEEDFVDIQKIFGNARFKNISAGHWIHAEKPMELLDIIVKFLHYN